MANSSRNPTSRSSSPSYRTSRVAEAVQVAPYLTHVVKHHGQITLIPPENMARIRKVKKKRPALRAGNSTGSVDSSRVRTPASRSRPQTPRPHSSNSARSPPSVINGPASTPISGPRDVRNHEDLYVPDFPPPSFEEAMLATPSPPPNNSFPGSHVRETPTMQSAPELLLPQETVQTEHAESANQSEVTALDIESESERSDSSHSSLEESIPTGPRSLWEQDREAGYSLEERVQRELERRRLSDSLPHAPPVRHLSREDASDAISEWGTGDVHGQTRIDDVLLAIQNKYRSRRKRPGLCRSSPQTSEAIGILADSYIQVETNLRSNDARSDSQEPNLPPVSRKGKEKEVFHEESPSLISPPALASPMRSPSESTLSSHRTPLRPQDENTTVTDVNSATASTSLVSPGSDYLARMQSVEPCSSHDSSTSLNVPSDMLDKNHDSASKGKLSIPSRYTTDSRNVMHPNPIPSSSQGPCSGSTIEERPSSLSRPSPPPPAESSTTPTSTFQPNVQRPWPSMPCTGRSVKDRIAAFESLQSRPVPPPPPTRPVIRRPPPPVPGPSNSNPTGMALGIQTADILRQSSRPDIQIAWQGSEEVPILPPRRRPPPPIPPRRKQQPNSIYTDHSHSVPTAQPSSSSSIRPDEINFVVGAANSNASDTLSPTEPRRVNEDDGITDRDGAAGRSPQPADARQCDNVERSISSGVPPREVVISPVTGSSDSAGTASSSTACNNSDGGVGNVLQGADVMRTLQESVVRPNPVTESMIEGEGVASLDDAERDRQGLPSNAASESNALHPEESDIDHPDAREASTVNNGAESAIDDPHTASHPQSLQPVFTGLTDLDLLLARLDDPDFTFSGRSYEDLLLLEEIMGPASSTSTRNLQKFEDIPLGRVEVLRRRLTKDGRTKLKLALLGVSVDKCGICLIQFRDGVFACLLPCRHAFHENCLRLWMRRGETCPLCRGPLTG